MAESFWKSRAVLVTGGTGLVGGWLLRELVARGAEVVALVRDANPRCYAAREGLLEQAAVAHGSLEDFALLRRVVSEYSVDTVFHLGAQTLVGVAKRDPMSTLEANVRGTWQLLEACRLGGVRQVVIASSDKAYGASDRLPYTESHPLEGRYPYDCSKSCADLIGTMYAVTYGLPVAVARCANIFGPGDLNFSRVLPDLIRSTLRGERLVVRSDGRFVRDYLYVRDAAEAYLCLAENLARQPEIRGQGFNFSLEVRLTVLELVEQVLELMGRPDLQPVILNQAGAEIREQYMQCDRAHQVLGWRARFSLEDGLRETIDWYAKYFHHELQALAVGG